MTDFYHPNDEGGILRNDRELGIDWFGTKKISEKDIILSEKDKRWESFQLYKEQRKRS